jgi:hypothetical protein
MKSSLGFGATCTRSAGVAFSIRAALLTGGTCALFTTFSAGSCRALTFLYICRTQSARVTRKTCSASAAGTSYLITREAAYRILFRRDTRSKCSAWSTDSLATAFVG